jgi:DNA-binding transcriptional MerR regulator
MSNLHRLPILEQRETGARDPVVPTPEKVLRVGELARACGKTVRAIHHYENVGLLKPLKRSRSGYRLYDDSAIARVHWIGKLHELGMTLTDIQSILKLWENSASAPRAMAQIRAVYHEKLESVHAQIARLSALERELHASLKYLDTCETCDPNELIAACSACSNHDDHHHEPELVAGLHAGSTTLPTTKQQA